MIAPSQGVHLVLDRAVPARRRPRSWCRRPTTAASCSRSPGTATRWSARPTRRSTTSPLEPRPLDGGGRLPPRHARPIPRPARRRAPTSCSVFAGLRPLVNRRRRGDRQRCRASTRIVVRVRPRHHHRRQVDDLSPHGRGRRRSSRQRGRPPAPPVPHRGASPSRLGRSGPRTRPLRDLRRRRACCARAPVAERPESGHRSTPRLP